MHVKLTWLCLAVPEKTNTGGRVGTPYLYKTGIWGLKIDGKQVLTASVLHFTQCCSVECLLLFFKFVCQGRVGSCFGGSVVFLGSRLAANTRILPSARRS